VLQQNLIYAAEVENSTHLPSKAVTMPESPLPRKISAPARIGNAYEFRLFALSCLKMLSDSSIEHVRHEDSSAAPADDVIVEFKDRIECFQAKHAMNPNALLEIDFDTAEFVEGTSKNCLIANEQKLKVLLYRSYSQ
jgi:hypothetical protein